MVRMYDLVYTDAYGTVSEKQRRAYRRHNVSPSDHDELVEHYGRDAHEEMTAAVRDPAYHLERGDMFSIWLWRQDHRED